MNYADKSRIIEDFMKLISFYAGKSCCEDMKSELMLFLLELISKGRAISRRYVAIALRNEYIRISKAEQNRRRTELPYNESIYTQDNIRDDIIDIKNVLQQLPQKQRDTLILHRVSGLSFDEIARKRGTTRQAQYRLEKRAAENARRLIDNGPVSSEKPPVKLRGLLPA